MQTIVNAEVIVTSIDLWLFHLINGSCGNRALDWLSAFAEGDYFFQGAAMMAAYWWLWFVVGSRQSTREKIIAALIGAIASLIVARILASTLPFRVRPLHRIDIGYRVPDLPPGMHPLDYENWSSFPSDHAALFFALSIGLWRCSRITGSIALVFTTFWICLVRIYLGVHLPSDVLIGAAIGIGCAFSFGRVANGRLGAQILTLELRFPPWFYAAMFLITYEFASVFDDVRKLMRGSYAALHAFGFSSIGLIGALVVALTALALVLGAIGLVLYRHNGCQFQKMPEKCDAEPLGLNGTEPAARRVPTS